MIYHFVVGDMAAAPLKAAVVSEASMNGEVIVLKDILHVGPVKKEEGQSFSATRTAFWQQVAPGEKNPIQVDDLERLLTVSNEMSKNEDSRAWFWMAPGPADVCAYYWLLLYLRKYIGRFYLVNIANLPFLDEAGKVFYPGSISQILPRELVKARRLARLVTPSEAEVDSEEWERITEENAAVRRHEGGKKLTPATEVHYDAQLTSFCSHQFQKASRVIRQAMSKYSIPTGDTYLFWRLRQLAHTGQLVLQGEVSKNPNEFEVRLPGEVAAESPAEAK